jgi:hypothetical protein
LWYSIPLVESEAALVFTGERLTSEDFDVLIEYVELFKKRFERTQKTESAQTTLPEPPFTVKLKTADFERMVEIVGSTVENGEIFFQEKDGTRFSASELFPNFKK